MADDAVNLFYYMKAKSAYRWAMWGVNAAGTEVGLSYGSSHAGQPNLEHSLGNKPPPASWQSRESCPRFATAKAWLPCKKPAESSTIASSWQAAQQGHIEKHVETSLLDCL